MITNFDYLKKDSKFSRFADVAISAEKIILMDPEASILNSRRAMEFAIKWMYSVDSELEMPYQDNLQSLMNAEEYRQIVGSDLWKRMDYIRRSGNNVAHSNKKLGMDEAMLCLEKFVYIFGLYCILLFNCNMRSVLLIKRLLLPGLRKQRNPKKLRLQRESNWKKNRRSQQNKNWI